MINPQWLELSMSRTIFYSPKDVRANEVRLYIKPSPDGMFITANTILVLYNPVIDLCDPFKFSQRQHRLSHFPGTCHLRLLLHRIWLPLNIATWLTHLCRVDSFKVSVRLKRCCTRSMIRVSSKCLDGIVSAPVSPVSLLLQWKRA